MKKNTLYSINLLVVSVSVSLLIGEAICRYQEKFITVYERTSGGSYASPYTVHSQGWLRLMPRSTTVQNQGKEFFYNVKTNSEGLPDREYTKEKLPHCYRIATLGDSYTEGAGAVMDSSWPRLLQQQLIPLHHDSLEVMDCGVSGSDPVYEYMLLKKKILQYHPDMVIVAINRTDIEDCIVRGGFERFQPDSTVRYADPPWWEGIYAHSFLFRTIMNGGLRYDHLLLSQDQFKARHQKAMQTLEQVTDSLSALCLQNNCRFMLVFHPIGQDLSENRMETQPILDYAKAKGFTTVDILNYFSNNGVNITTKDKYYWLIDGHNKPSGYLLIAHAVADQIEHDHAISP